MTAPDLDRTLQDALAAYRPSARVKDRVRARLQRAQSGVSVLFVAKDSGKILERLFRKVDKQFQKIA